MPGLRPIWLFAGIACAAAIARALPAPSFTIDVHAIGNGTAALGSSCSRMVGAIGEPAPGFSSGGGFALSAGLQAIFAGAGDVLFFDGFEGCVP